MTGRDLSPRHYYMKHRKTNRLSSYDYSQNGLYFVTICTKAKKCYFGNVIDDKIKLNEYGKITQKVLIKLPNHYNNIIIDEYVIMPNHVHIIIEINDNVGTGLKPVPTQHGLSEIIRGFKTFSSRKINDTKPKNKFEWQRSFYDHVIRQNESLNKIREYIMINPQEWNKDKFYITNYQM